MHKTLRLININRAFLGGVSCVKGFPGERRGFGSRERFGGAPGEAPWSRQGRLKPSDEVFMLK